MVLTYRYAFSTGKYPPFNLSCHATNISPIAKSCDLFNFGRFGRFGITKQYLKSDRVELRTGPEDPETEIWTMF